MKELHHQAKRFSLGERVRFTGFVFEDLHILLKGVEVFTIPGESE